MKVKDLIKELQDADPEADIVFEMADGCCSDMEYLELGDTYFDEHLMYNVKGDLVRPKDLPNGTFRFFFKALWFMDTCITSGTAKRAAREHKDRVKAHMEGKPDGEKA